MVEFLLQAIGEFLLQVIVEALVELGFHSLAELLRKPPNPWLTTIGYVLLGTIAGGLSLLLFSAYLVNGGWRRANLIITPVAVGLLMCLMGRWRSKKGQEVLRIDRFAYGYLFALSFALVRFWFAG